jgi:hypothetical protein
MLYKKKKKKIEKSALTQIRAKRRYYFRTPDTHRIKRALSDEITYVMGYQLENFMPHWFLRSSATFFYLFL